MLMNILVTAGNTQTPIDKVRCLTNIFSGKTGGRIALEALRRGHAVTHLTSHPEIIAGLAEGTPLPADRWRLLSYQTFDDLSGLMERLIPASSFHVIVHAAAVSDYALGGVFTPDPVEKGALIATHAGKIRSTYPELWLRLVPTPKLVDQIRSSWGFAGTLVKFKLEVGVGDDALLDLAEQSRKSSGANLMVANTLEGMQEWAFLGPLGEQYVKVPRADLAKQLLDAIEVMEASAK